MIYDGYAQNSEIKKTGSRIKSARCLVRKISDSQPGGPGFDSRPGRGLNFG